MMPLMAAGRLLTSMPRYVLRFSTVVSPATKVMGINQNTTCKEPRSARMYLSALVSSRQPLSALVSPCQPLSALVSPRPTRAATAMEMILVRYPRMDWDIGRFAQTTSRGSGACVVS